MGEGEEADQEREVVAGPTGEAIVHSSGNMPLLPFLINIFFFSKTSHEPFLTTFYCSIPFHCEMDFHPELCLSLYFWSILCADESKYEGEWKWRPKGNRNQGLYKAGWRWEVYQHWMKRRCKNCCRRYIPLISWYPLDIYMGFHFASHISVFVSHF